MNKTPLLFLLLVLAATAVAFLVWGDDDPQGGQPPAPATLGELAFDSTAAEVLNAVATVDDESETAPLPEGLERIAVPASEAAGLLAVQVWDGKPGVPAAGAAVFVLDDFEGPEFSDPFAQHWSDLAEQRGLHFRTDLQGRVELPAVRSQVIVTATLHGAYGFAKLGPEHAEVETITLQPDETVTVRVVDAQGRPAPAVPVGVVQHLPLREDPAQLNEQLKQIQAQMARVDAFIRDNPTQREAAMGRVQGLRERQGRLTAALRQSKADGKPSADPRAQATEQLTRPSSRPDLRARRLTDAEGLAVFRHFQVYRNQPENWWPREQWNQFEAVLLMPLQRPESRAFAGRPVPSETIELHLPPTGSIALRTVDRDGRPFTHPVIAELRLQDVATVPWARVKVRKEQNEATIDFPFVGLGLSFTAGCQLDDQDFRWQAPPFAGPQSPGEQVIVDLVVAPGDGMLFGRVLDAAGVPLAGIRPTFLISSLAGRLEGEEVILDAAGCFHLPYRVRPQHHGPFRFEIRRDDVRPTAGLVMTLPQLPSGRVTDLGDMQIDAFALIAQGGVVDDRGEPLQTATIQLQHERIVGGEPPRREFVDEAFCVARTDEKGRYELFGELEAGRYRLRAQAQDHFPFETPDLLRGPQPEMQLQRRSKVVGTVLTPEWMQSRGIRVRLESASDPAQGRDDQVHDYQGKKYLYFDWVRPGLYNLVLSLPGFPDPFVRVDQLEIPPGKQDLHPRLIDLDLGAYLHRFEIVAVDEDNQIIQPDRPLLARIARPDGRTGFVGFPWKQGKVEVIGAQWQLEVVAWAVGYRAEPTVLGQGRSELRFLSIPPVDLQVAGLRQLVGPTPVLMLMELRSATSLPDQLEKWDGGSSRMSGWYQGGKAAGAQLGESDTVQIKVMGDGRYLVRALVGWGQSKRPVAVEFGEVEVRLVPGAGPQRITVDVDAQRVQSALAELRSR